VARALERRVRLGQHLDLANFYNLLNAASVIAIQTGYNNSTPGTPQAWENVITLLGPRIIKWGVRVNF
jgi:hypothetical protein